MKRHSSQYRVRCNVVLMKGDPTGNTITFACGYHNNDPGAMTKHLQAIHRGSDVYTGEFPKVEKTTPNVVFLPCRRNGTAIWPTGIRPPFCPPPVLKTRSVRARAEGTVPQPIVPEVLLYDSFQDAFEALGFVRLKTSPFSESSDSSETSSTDTTPKWTFYDETCSISSDTLSPTTSTPPLAPPSPPPPSPQPLSPGLAVDILLTSGVYSFPPPPPPPGTALPHSLKLFTTLSRSVRPFVGKNMTRRIDVTASPHKRYHPYKTRDSVYIEDWEDSDQELEEMNVLTNDAF
jgi:hypothetical protein